MRDGPHFDSINHLLEIKVEGWKQGVCRGLTLAICHLNEEYLNLHLKMLSQVLELTGDRLLSAFFSLHPA